MAGIARAVSCRPCLQCGRGFILFGGSKDRLCIVCRGDPEGESPAPKDVGPLELANALLEGWNKWTRDRKGQPKGPIPWGIVVGIAGVREGSNALILTDDHFVIVERSILLLVWRWQEILHLEYRGYWRDRPCKANTQPDKWHKVGLRRHAYTASLSAAQAAFHNQVKPHLDKWLQRKL